MIGAMKKSDKIIEEYIRKFPPSENIPSIGIDLIKLSRYARKNNKKVSELSDTEINMFRTI